MRPRPLPTATAAVALTLAGAATALATGAGGAADVAAPIPTLTGAVSPAITGFPSRPRSLALKVALRIDTDPPGRQPAGLTHIDLYFPHGARVNGRFFPSCGASKLDARGPEACPKGSRIGTGSLVGFAVGVREKIKLTAYNGPKGHSVILYLRGNNPVRIAQAISAPLRTVHLRRYGYELSITVPSSLRRIAGVPAALASFTTTVRGTTGKGRHRHGFVEAYACPPGARIPLRGVLTFAGAPRRTLDSFVECR